MLPLLQSLKALVGLPHNGSVKPFDKLFVSGPIELDRLEAREGVDGNEDIGSMSDNVRSSFKVSMHLSIADTQLLRIPDVIADRM